MSPEQVLKLLDTNWFETSIFTNINNQIKSSHLHSTKTTLLDSTSMLSHFEQLLLDTKLPTLQLRSFSSENLLLSTKIGSFSVSLSPNSVLTTPQKLKPILSGKEVVEESFNQTTKKASHHHNHNHRTRHRKGRRPSRSLSELEFKELKGFMDLGFVFCEEDKDSKLVSLIPGLQLLGKNDSFLSKNGELNFDESVICRPYLSEAWGVINQKKIVNPLLNWRVPTLGNEIDMKDNLKFWAHTVASIVR